MSSASPEDREIIHRLAERVAEIAVGPINCERRESWRAMHDLEPVRPMILAEVCCRCRSEMIGDKKRR